MALDGTYAGLLASVADWLNRSDLTAQIPDFVTLAETKLNRDLRLRVRQSEQPLSTVVASRFVALPAGFDEAITLWINWASGREEITPVNAPELNTLTSQGRPYYWAVDGTNLAFERPADQAYSLTLRCQLNFSAAAGSAPALFILQNFPDLYLYGALLAAAPFLRDDTRIPTWNALFKEAKAEVKAHESRAASRGPMRVDAALRRNHGQFNINSGDYGR